MMNKKILSLFAFLLVLPLVSAFYIEDILYSEWGEFIVLAAVFIIIFAFIHFSLSKSFFKENIGTCAVISLAISALISYALYKEEAIDWLIEIISTGSSIIVTIGVIIVFIVILWAFIKFLKKSFKPSK